MLNNLIKYLENSSSSNSFNSISSKQNNTLKTQIVVYNFNKGKNLNILKEKENANTLLKYFFSSISCLISKPVFIFSPNKVIIQLCFYKPDSVLLKNNNKVIFSLSSLINKTNKIKTNNKWKNIKKSKLVVPSKVYQTNFNYLGFMLTQIFNKPVELKLIPLRYPYLDSNILAQTLGLNSNKLNFNNMIKKLLSKINFINNSKEFIRGTNNIINTKNNVGLTNEKKYLTLPISQLTGIKIKIAGRLLTQRIIPKATVKTAYKGNLYSKINNNTSLINQGKNITNNFVDSATYTSKNKLGTYSVRVWLGHKIIN